MAKPFTAVYLSRGKGGEGREERRGLEGRGGGEGGEEGREERRGLEGREGGGRERRGKRLNHKPQQQIGEQDCGFETGLWLPRY